MYIRYILNSYIKIGKLTDPIKELFLKTLEFELISDKFAGYWTRIQMEDNYKIDGDDGENE